MPLQIIYSSESSTPMQMDELEDILQQARVSNAAAGITGALIYVDGVFMQILEGEADTVRGLMARIAKDLRHETVTVLKEAAIPAAVFNDWKMAYVSATPEQVAQWIGLSGTTAIPEILIDLRQDPHRTARLAEGILAALASEPASQDQTG